MVGTSQNQINLQKSGSGQFDYLYMYGSGANGSKLDNVNLSGSKYGIMEGAAGDADRERYARYTQEMIDLDLQNTRDLLDLIENTTTEFMVVSSQGQTAFIYGENLPDDLRRKIELTEKYRNVEPFIDPEILWRLE